MGLLRRIYQIDDGPGMGVLGWSEVMDQTSAFLSRMEADRKG